MTSTSVLIDVPTVRFSGLRITVQVRPRTSLCLLSDLAVHVVGRDCTWMYETRNETAG